MPKSLVRAFVELCFPFEEASACLNLSLPCCRLLLHVYMSDGCLSARKNKQWFAATNKQAPDVVQLLCQKKKAFEPIAHCAVSEKELCSFTAIHTHCTHSRVDCLEFTRMQVALQCRMLHYTLSLSIGYMSMCVHIHTPTHRQRKR